MCLTMKLLVDFVYTFRNFVNVYQQKRNVAVYTCNRFTLSWQTFIMTTSQSNDRYKLLWVPDM